MKATQGWAPLRSANFAWYFASRFVNTLGTAMATVALTFAVLDLTGSASSLGQVLAAHTIPMVLFLLYGGVLSDRVSRVLVIQLSNLTSALTQGLIAALVLTDSATMPLLIALSAVHGAVSAMSFPAMFSVLPDLVPRAELQQANALVSLTRNAVTVIGPTLGALLVVTVGPGWALAADAAAWALAALLLLPVRIPPRAPSGAAPDTLAELREGWSFFWSVSWLWQIVVAFSVLNLIHTGAIYTLGPLIAEDSIGRQAWGWLLSAEAVGLLVTSVVFLRVRLERPLLYGMLAVSLVAAPILLLGVHATTPTLLFAFFLAGLGVEVFGLGWNLAMQENIDTGMLSRASSYDALGSLVAMPLGQLLYGPLAERFGIREVMVVSGVLYAGIALATLASRSIRTLPRRDADASSGSVESPA